MIEFFFFFLRQYYTCCSKEKVFHFDDNVNELYPEGKKIIVFIIILDLILKYIFCLFENKHYPILFSSLVDILVTFTINILNSLNM